MNWSRSNLLAFLQRFCVDVSVDSADLMRFISLRTERIYNKALKFFKAERTFTTVAGTKYYYLSRDMNVALGLRFFNQSNSTYKIHNRDYDEVLTMDPDESETGTPNRACFVELCPVQRQPIETSDNGTLLVLSSDATDLSQRVVIVGRALISGQEVEFTEELTLAGTTPVSSARNWRYIYQLSKSADTAGYITVTDSTGTFIYAIIDQYSDSSEYQKWRLWPTPTSADVIKYTGHRRAIMPARDGAVLDVPQDLQAGFVQGLRSDIHRVNFDMIQAKEFEAMFLEDLQEKISNDTWNDGEQTELAPRRRRYNPLRDIEDVPEDSVS